MEEIDLRQIFKIFYEKKIFIIVSTILLLVLGYFYTKYFLTPRFQSSTTLILTKNEASQPQTYSTNSNNDPESLSQSDITLNNALINTYREIIKSKTVLAKVIETVGLRDISEGSLANSIDVVAVSNTSIIKITVTDKDPILAEKIANAIPDIFGSEVDRIFKIQNVNILDKAETSYSPYNVSYTKNIAMFGAAGFILSLMIVMLLFYLDNTIKTSDDIENFIGLNTLSVVPQVKTIV